MNEERGFDYSCIRSQVDGDTDPIRIPVDGDMDPIRIPAKLGIPQIDFSISPIFISRAFSILHFFLLIFFAQHHGFVICVNP